MDRSRLLPAFLAILAACTAVTQAGPLKLNAVFTDHMVLQRDKPIVIRGSADKGAKVTVNFAGQQETGQAGDHGNWSVRLDPMPASSEPRKLTVRTPQTDRPLTLDNVVVGDVILHARQTSIDISLSRDEEGRRAASSHRPNPALRAISIKSIPSPKPLSDLAANATTGWSLVDKDSALKMTASAYYLGRDLAKDADVPVGIIDLNMGHAFANHWLSREALMETGKFYTDKAGTAPDHEVASLMQQWEERLDCELKGINWRKEKTPPEDTLHHPLFPHAGYNGTLCPLAGTGLKAVVLQLGNDYPYMAYQRLLDSDNPFDRDALDAAYALTYDLRKVGFRMEPKVVPRITREWRKVLGDTDLPFGLIVPPGSDLNTLGQHHREMRELQRWAAADNPKVGIILPGSGNIAFSAQPADESLLAKRCLSWVEGAVYGKPGVPATGPLFDRFEASFNEATIHFREGTAKGLSARGDALDYFEAANVEGDYSPVEATIDGETIRIRSDVAARIVRVRYNWNQRPNQGLVNAAGLPAIPFRSERAAYHWFVRNDEEDLPEEYFTPANEWKKSDVTLFNAKISGQGYENFTGWIGPAGFRTAPFGPNMSVREIRKGSPADGRLQPGDTIYSANGSMLGDSAWEVMAAAVTESETHEHNGKLVLGLRRGAENLDVELTLEVMGAYSSTAPFDCNKTGKIVANLEKWLLSQDPGAGFLNHDAVFMLATGNPELSGYVRRAVYKILEEEIPTGELDGRTVGKSWYNSADAFLLGEYYLATGDRNVLAHLKYACDKLAASQQPEGGWRHNYPGGISYGYIPPAGLPGVMGMHFAKEAGVDINMKSYQLGVHHFKYQRAETGQIIYGKGQVPRPVPRRFEPSQMLDGSMHTYNGAVSAAGILMGFVNDHRSAHLCSAISTYSYNHTHDGHGGNFWNNFWTPLGAHQHSKEAFIHFWKNHRWYRECSRMYDGSLIGGGRPTAGYGVALVAPRRRIQIVGAPPSPFSVDAPAVLKPALEAHRNRDYPGCRKIVGELIAGGTVAKDDLPTVEYLARAAAEMAAGIDADFARMNRLIDAGDPAAAKSFLASLQGVMPGGDERLVAMQKTLASVAVPAGTKRGKKAPAEKTVTAADIDATLARMKGLIDDGNLAAAKAFLAGVQDVMPEGDERLVEIEKALAKMPEQSKDAENPRAEATEKPRQWVCLVLDNQAKDPKRFQRDRRGAWVTSNLERANLWKIEVIESMTQAPDDWSAPNFDDSGWLETELPISWRTYHTALLRTRFNVEDRNSFDTLRLHAWVLRQQGMEIYLNGELIGKISGVGKSTTLENEFKESALKHLRNGENTLAIKTRHNWRWGHRGMYAYNGGFDFNLDGRLKEEE